MPQGFADAFLESIFQGRAEAAQARRQQVQLQFEAARNAQQHQIEQQRLQNEQQYQQALIRDTQQRNAREGQQYQQSQDWTKTLAGFQAQAQGLATPVQPQVNTAPQMAQLMQPPTGGMPGPDQPVQRQPLPSPTDEAQNPSTPLQNLPPTMMARQGPLLQAPPGATEFGPGQFLQPRTVEERQAAEHATKLAQDKADMDARHADQDEYTEKLINRPDLNLNDKQKTAIRLENALSHMDEKRGTANGTLRTILNGAATPTKSPTLDDYTEMKYLGKSSAGFYSDQPPEVVKAIGEAGFKSLRPDKPPKDNAATYNNEYNKQDSIVSKMEQTTETEADQIRRARAALQQGGAIDPLALGILSSMVTKRQSTGIYRDIEGGKSIVERGQTALQNITTAKKIGDTQRKDLLKYLDAEERAITPKRQAYMKAHQDLSPSSDPDTNANVVKKLRQTIEPAPGASTSGASPFDVQAIKAALGNK